VAVVTIDRPPLNILPFALFQELSGLIIGLIEEKKARAVIITGTAAAFVSGLDIKDIALIKTADENDRMTLEVKALFRRIEKLPRPVIAAIDGNCFGGGLELALACHMRVASHAARLALPEINVGAMPSFGGTQRLSRVVGRARALELMLTGRSVIGDEAFAMGLVNQVHPSSVLVEKARELAGQIAEKNYESIEAVMRATTEGLEMDCDRGMVFESTCSSGLIGTYNAKEGKAAFFERRRPSFKDESGAIGPS
jgi:enoyl-CoA hydratase/carnithine racemase